MCWKVLKDGGGGALITGAWRLGKAGDGGRINACREKFPVGRSRACIRWRYRDSESAQPLFLVPRRCLPRDSTRCLATMLAAPWVCRSCVRSLRRAGALHFVRRASTGITTLMVTSHSFNSPWINPDFSTRNTQHTSVRPRRARAQTCSRTRPIERGFGK